jgi:hypothetical protein
MKIFNWEIKKIPKEKIVVLKVGNVLTEIKLEGDGWGTIERLEVGNEITRLYGAMPKRLTVNERVKIFELFLSDELTFKIIE